MLKAQQNQGSTAGYSGSILTTYQDGKVIGERIIYEDEHVSSLEAFIEIAQAAGWHVSLPESSGKEINHA
ncbi:MULTISPECIES: hypothetical protein [unclassified Serratia (in: enterobacteria)]|uniref:hypothetical protein n=1 Tax=unclassified Serratia (in: enterobacteria) TaxID=2647522 RepID=UPI0030767847